MSARSSAIVAMTALWITVRHWQELPCSSSLSMSIWLLGHVGLTPGHSLAFMQLLWQAYEQNWEAPPQCLYAAGLCGLHLLESPLLLWKFRHRKDRLFYPCLTEYPLGFRSRLREPCSLAEFSMAVMCLVTVLILKNWFHFQKYYQF